MFFSATCPLRTVAHGITATSTLMLSSGTRPVRPVGQGTADTTTFMLPSCGARLAHPVGHDAAGTAPRDSASPHYSTAAIATFMLSPGAGPVRPNGLGITIAATFMQLFSGTCAVRTSGSNATARSHGNSRACSAPEQDQFAWP